MPRILLWIQPGFQVPGHEPCFSGTPFAIKVQRILGAKRLRFEVREVGWAERAELLPKLSASGKLPVLEYAGERVEDSTAIAYFLEARHPEPALLPADPVLRARCHFLEEWADEVLYWYGIYEQCRITQGRVAEEAYFAGLPEALRRIAIERRRAWAEEILDRQGIGRYPPPKVKANVRRGLDALSVFVEADGYVAGSRLSLADCALFGQLHRRLAGTNPWLEGEMAARPPLTSWRVRVDQETGALPER